MEIVISEKEKDRIYRLNGRLTSLEELLKTFEDTSIEMKSAKYKIEICKYKKDVRKKINDWWDEIYEKYKLDKNKPARISFEDRTITQM
ncbi:MAG: CXXX repeat peptide modification system protein [Oscillospiraceae bacterium]|nr:CXXX repeat peptide modification system protein [Oscillospiraceae bacterium]